MVLLITYKSSVTPIQMFVLILGMFIAVLFLCTNFVQILAGHERDLTRSGNFGVDNKKNRMRRQSTFDDQDTSQGFQLENFGELDDIIIFDNGDFRSSNTPRQVSLEGFNAVQQNFPENIISTISPIPDFRMNDRNNDILQNCEQTCPSTQEYNPVCGDDNKTYPNIGKLQCAVKCGKSVSLQFRGACLTRARGK